MRDVSNNMCTLFHRSQQGISVTSSSSDDQRKRKHDKLGRRDSSSDTDSSINDVDDPKNRDDICNLTSSNESSFFHLISTEVNSDS